MTDRKSKDEKVRPEQTGRWAAPDRRNGVNQSYKDRENCSLIKFTHCSEEREENGSISGKYGECVNLRAVCSLWLL